MEWYTASPETVAAEAKRRNRIPDEEFKTVLDWAMIPTADFILTRLAKDDETVEFSLARREEGSWKGEFFVTGGRIMPGTHPDESVKANCKREMGFWPEKVKFIGHLPVMNPCRSDGTPNPW